MSCLKALLPWERLQARYRFAQYGVIFSKTKTQARAGERLLTKDGQRYRSNAVIPCPLSCDVSVSRITNATVVKHLKKCALRRGKAKSSVLKLIAKMVALVLIELRYLAMKFRMLCQEISNAVLYRSTYRKSRELVHLAKFSA